MFKTPTCQELQQALGELFTCSDQGDCRRIRTPYLYPDGDIIDLYCKIEGNAVRVSDLAETSGWLRMQSASPRRTSRQTRLIEDVCLTLGVDFDQGTLQARCQVDDDLADVVTRVAQAALRVSDLWFTFRTQAIQRTPDDVADFLAEREIGFVRREKLKGRSGRDWTIDFLVRTEVCSSLVQVLTTGSRAAARRVCEHALAAWHDLSHLKVGKESLAFVSLFDDTTDVWSSEDFALVEPLSTISHWSRPEDLAAVLGGAA